jgi:hypothetical protein
MTEYWKYFGQKAPFLIIELGSKVQRSEVQRLFPSFNYPYGINDIGKNA